MKTPEEEFVQAIFWKFMSDKSLIEQYETPDIYIIKILTDFRDDGSMSSNRAQAIFNVMFSTINRLLTEFGV